MELVEGVYLHVLPNQGFATTHIQVNFTQNLVANMVGPRVLASNMVETVSAELPSQKLMAQAQSKLYGADFNVDVMKTGQLHTVRASLVLADNQYLPAGEDTLQAGLAFLKSSLLYPLIDGDHGFDLTVFERQKGITLDELAGLKEDRQYLALRQALQIYFASKDQALPAFGSEALLEETDRLTAYHAWQTMLTNDRVDIVVFGEVDVEMIRAAFMSWQWVARQPKLSLNYQQPLLDEIKTVRVQSDVNQAHLVLIYQLKVSAKERFAAYVFNMLFGGHAVSRLFMNVRESAGLAYAISSDYNLFTGVLLVEAGVERSNLVETRQRIEAELARLQTELVSPDELATIKQLMNVDFLLALDQPARIVDRELTQALTNQHTSAAEWQANLKAVTAEDVMQVALRAQLQLDYALQGGEA